MRSLDLDTLRHLADLAGFAWSEAELEAIRPDLERALRGLERLEQLPLPSVEPATQYRVL
jgi:Asp-tRNA(Asn)/Glu-tRNA(Gln) amidotransferase C subunit